MSTYSEMLKHPKWQKKRLEILERDKWCCVKCGDTETTLHIHHLKYTGKPWEAPAKDLSTLCADCHLLFSKTDVDFEFVVKIVKFPKVYVESNIRGVAVCYKMATAYYNIEESIINHIITFSKKSTILKKLYQLNNG